MSSKLIPRFFFEPPKPYPYKTARSPDELERRKKGPTLALPPPKLPETDVAKALVKMIDGGLPSVVSQSKELVKKVRWQRPFSMF